MIDERELATEEAATPQGRPQTDSAGGAAPAALGADGIGGPSIVRCLGAAALTSSAAGAMAGGVFGSGAARTLAAAAAVFGAAWAALTLRASKRAMMLQALILPVLIFAGAIALIPGGSDPSEMSQLVREAISAGRLLRPPAPFDPGWRPILIVLFGMLGYASAWVATALRRPKMGLAMSLPILGLTAISQPAEGELAAGLIAFVPLMGALALLFGGDRVAVTELSSSFELKRGIRGVLFGGLAVAALVGLNSSNALFPRPVYNPAEQARKPRPIPLGAVRDRVLFEVSGELTGPWRTGVLDVYDGRAWRLPPFDPARFETLPGDGRVDPNRSAEVTVRITVRDMGNTATLPGVATPARIADIDMPGRIDLVFDPRTELLRLETGRVPAGLTYELSLPSYPGADELRGASPPSGIGRDLTFAPKAPPRVASLVDQAPPGLWDRLDFLRGRLNEVVVAAGAGVPIDVPPGRVDDLLFGSREGSPFEIVAAEALLARWAGIPSRVGFGFDGVLEEEGLNVVRPKLASTWLEVYFEGFGWVPIIGAPQQAKATLDTDPNARFDPTIQPSDDVAVEIFVPIELENIRLLYERVRDQILRALPWVGGVVAIYVSLPALRRALRRRKRRRWAAEAGPRAQIAVEYAEFRDLATDLGVGDAYDTPLEYLDKVAEDAEHSELAWLVSRSLYGDLRRTVSPKDVEAARDMAASLRRRMFRAQPWQTRTIAVLSRSSLKQPYTVEIPSVRQIRLRRRALSEERERRLVGAGR